MTDPNLDRIIADRYQLVELIGRGAMGRVYRARHVLLDAPVAVKFLSQTLLNKRMRDRFKREARSCFLLGQKSKHIVQVLDYGVDDDEVPFYVMEYLQGQDLSTIIKRERMPLPRFLNLAHQICLGLQAAHQGILLENRLTPIVHRDIKPSNLLVIQDPEKGELVKILDFGIAKLLQEDQGQTSHFMGTLAYSAPEQMDGKELDSRADLYSFGIVMYEMLTGKMPLQADTHSFGAWYKTHHELPPRAFSSANPTLQLPKVLESLILQCLSKRPSDRPKSVNEILKVLEPMEQRYRPGRAIGQRIESTLSRTPNPLPSPDAIAAPQTAAKKRLPSDPNTLCRLQTWPPSKPVAEIVFPKILPTSHQPLVTIWVMLPEQTIRALQISDEPKSLYNRFMGCLSPHPMVLWLTVLYVCQPGSVGDSVERRPKWLPCYLDLKTNRGYEMARLLGEHRSYRVLFFALENPHTCAHVSTLSINSSHAEMVQQWVSKSRNLPATQATLSKNHLKQELDRAKPQILRQMEQNAQTARSS